MIKILHVVSSLNINAGMMSVIMNYYRNIDRSKIQFDFWYFEEMKETHQAEITQLGGKTYFMPYRTFISSDQREIRRFFQEHKGEYIAVHCHPIWSSFVIAREAKHGGIKHVIQHIHSTKYSEKASSEKRNRLLMKFISWFATDYIACNQEAKYLFGKQLAESGRVVIVPNAIDVEKYKYNEDERNRIREELLISDDTFVVGTVGRLSVEKNQLFIIDVFYELLRIHTDSKLIIVGDGKMREAIEQKIVDLNLQSKAILTGKRRDVQALLSAFDLFLMPSLFEGTPVSALEARTAGLPCLMSDTITKSVDMPGMDYYPLQRSSTEWANECFKLYEQWKTCNRHDYIEVVKRGFDIKTEAGKLQDYYVKLR